MKWLDAQTLDQLTEKAKQAERLRTHFNLHELLDEPVQRLAVAMEPGSYIRPHRHPQQEKWEFFTVLRGTLLMLIFDDDGRVEKRMELSGTGPLYGIELPPGTWHTVISLESGSVFVEVKQGPYTPLDAKDFAEWAPEENTPFTSRLVDELKNIQVGEKVSFSKS